VAVLYMVVEEYRLGPGPVYERAAAQGRMLPEGLRYIDSWVTADERPDRCFQLMETDSPELLDVWQARWADLVDFDVFPVITSGEAAQRAAAGPRTQVAPPGAGDAGTSDRPELPAAGGKPSSAACAGGSDQTCPAFARAEQQVLTIRRVTTYGSTFAFGRRSSM
jgi:hypothetical protein